ncbi:glycosyltransferase family A protein [Agaribacterium haliotis]|uniref:glycosyltransferase family A protein n=1 Tax=Agaribacterium haliotis TaxID=2013869 RepID=UPI000BB55706|nr:glycosyltransferase family A protein [Agaribacterium haliotis]
MKLKELPASLLRSAQLSLQKPSSLSAKANKRAEGLIVSFTSIAPRLHVVHLTVRSLLAQSVEADFIVLWLQKGLENKVPKRLLKLQSDQFKINYVDEGCSHRKLVEAMRHYPGKSVVTCDDDMLYGPDWLERLWHEHQRFPHSVIAHECRRIATDKSGKTLPYKYWQSEECGLSHRNTLAIGYGGVLYPAGLMPEQSLERELYMQLAPRADDLWFKAMSLRAGIDTRRSELSRPKPQPIAFSQSFSLKKHNVREDGNLLQWNALAEHFALNL